MDYIGSYLPFEASKTQKKQVFADISHTNIKITLSTRYLSNIWCPFSVDSRKRVEVKFVYRCSWKLAIPKLAAL